MTVAIPLPGIRHTGWEGRPRLPYDRPSPPAALEQQLAHLQAADDAINLPARVAAELARLRRSPDETERQASRRVLAIWAVRAHRQWLPDRPGVCQCCPGRTPWPCPELDHALTILRGEDQ